MDHIDSLTALQDLRAALESEQRRINEEIRGYPPPIPRCDAQFNGLLEERAAVAQALYDLDAITRGERFASMAELQAVSELVHCEAEQRVRAVLADVRKPFSAM